MRCVRFECKEMEFFDIQVLDEYLSSSHCLIKNLEYIPQEGKLIFCANLTTQQEKEIESILLKDFGSNDLKKTEVKGE